jgi:hypothetical protein
MTLAPITAVTEIKHCAGQTTGTSLFLGVFSRRITIGFEVGRPTIWLQAVFDETPAGTVLKLEYPAPSH